MRKKIARDFCSECINQVLDKNSYVENPAVKFTRKAKNGDFDTLSDKEYDTLLGEAEQLAKLFGDRPRRAAGSILLEVLANAPKANDKLKDDLADLFARLLAGPDDGGIPPLSAETLKAVDGYVCEQTEEMLDDLEHRFDDLERELIREPFRILPPRKIRDAVARQVIGQPEAVKAAALITYNQLSGRRTNAVFAGPSGCGKSEIWRVLSKEYPGLIRIMDFSRFSADGWRGSLHLRDVFNGVDPKDMERRGLVVVLDEADKIVCEHAVGGGGTDYNMLLQNDLLKMMDGDVIEFGAEDKLPALSVDCSKISIVMLGAFERLLDGKTRGSRHIGFGTVPVDTGKARHGNISCDDLINAGMRREVAGRVNKIIALEPLALEDYRAILAGPLLSGIQEAGKCRISVDRAAAGALAEQAVKSGLGVRRMRSEILAALDDARFDAPDAGEYRITMRDGGLRCRARTPRGGARAERLRPAERDVEEDMPF